MAGAARQHLVALDDRLWRERYRFDAAHKRAHTCTIKPRVERRLRPGTTLWDSVMHYLKAGYSPEQVTGTLARGGDRHGRRPGMVSIHDRPPEIEERLIPGHWKDDFIKGAHNRSSAGTLVEWAMLFTVPAKMENATAEATLTGFSHVLNRIDAQKRLSLTYDHDREMAAHQRLTEVTGLQMPS